MLAMVSAGRSGISNDSVMTCLGTYLNILYNYVQIRANRTSEVKYFE
jgi:hypothetical protein